MKVLQVSCEGLGNGGVQNVIMNICREITEIKFDILLFTSEKRYYDNEFERLGGNIYRIPNYEGKNRIRKKIDYYIRFLRIFKGTYKILRNNGPYDAIHCHNELESGICNFAAFFAGIKIRISHAHTVGNKFSKRNFFGYSYKKLLQIVMNKFSNIKIGCTTRAIKSLYGEKYCGKTNTFIIPNSIDLRKFNQYKENKISVKSSEVSIVNVGRYEENKNQLFLVRAFSYVLAMYPNSKLRLMGYGEEYRAKIEKEIERLNITNNIEFIPHDSDIIKLLSDASIFILPSISEGYGIVLLEAQAMNVPCLVSDTVPKEVDCGLCKFISLTLGEERWAEEAVKVINQEPVFNLNIDKLNSLDNNNYIKVIRNLYKGEES